MHHPNLIKRIAVVCMIISLVILTVVCGLVFIPSDTLGRIIEKKVLFEPITAVHTEDPEVLKSCIIKISNNFGGAQIYGTGFFVTDGCLITGSNIVDTEGTVTVTYSDGTTSDAFLVSNDIDHNMAILKVDNPEIDALEYPKESVTASEKISLHIVGFDSLSDVPEVIDASGQYITPEENIITIDERLDSSYIGSPVIDDKGNMLGVVTLANNGLPFSMAGAGSAIEESTKKLMYEQSVHPLTEPVRMNRYTSAAMENYNVSVEDLYLEGIYIQGSAVSKNQVVLNINQRNSKFIVLNYDAQDAVNDVLVGTQESKAIVKVTTDRGEYSCNLNWAMVRQGDQGQLPLIFEDFSGIAKQITITSFSDETGVDRKEEIIIPLAAFVKTVRKPEEDSPKALENDEELLELLNGTWGGTYNYEQPQYFLEALADGFFSWWNDHYLSGYDHYWDGVPEDQFRWVVQNILNVDDTQYKTFKDSMIFMYDSFGQRHSQADGGHVGYHDGRFGIYAPRDGYGLYYSKVLGIENVSQDGDKMILDLYGVNILLKDEVMFPDGADKASLEAENFYFGMPKDAIRSDYLMSGQAVVEKKKIDGKEYWTLYSLEYN